MPNRTSFRIFQNEYCKVRVFCTPSARNKNPIRAKIVAFAATALLSFSATDLWAFDWSAFIGGAANSLADQMAEERRAEQRRRLLEQQYQLERENAERLYQLELARRERERGERERAEREKADRERVARVDEDRRREIERQQQKAAEEKKLREEAEAKRNTVSTGTGFFVAKGGYLVTNHHVIEDATDFAIRDSKGRFYKAVVVASDANRDLALLRVDGNFPALNVANSDLVSKGQRVLAVGYPQISIQGNESKVTDGIVSSFSGLRNDDTWFQISVPIQGGNSGGPLVTEAGAVVGVVVATANVARFLKLTGNLPQNVNYAIKSNVLLDFLKSQRIATVAASKAKVTIDGVDASTVLVIAKNGSIEVNYTTTHGPVERQTAQLAPARGQPTRGRSAEEIEDIYWDSIKSGSDKTAFDDYLKEYPSGRYAPLARRRAQALSPAVARPSPTPGAVASPNVASGNNAVPRFAVTNAGTVRDSKTGLEWNQADSEVKTFWNVAVLLCNGKGERWRLPTVNELQEIRDPSLSVSCGGFTCHVSPVFRLGGLEFWSSERIGNHEAWGVYLGSGNRSKSFVGESANMALCVRSP